eukprot:5045047-Amphidinium_carterae.1
MQCKWHVRYTLRLTVSRSHKCHSMCLAWTLPSTVRPFKQFAQVLISIALWLRQLCVLDEMDTRLFNQNDCIGHYHASSIRLRTFYSTQTTDFQRRTDTNRHFVSHEYAENSLCKASLAMTGSMLSVVLHARPIKHTLSDDSHVLYHF